VTLASVHEALGPEFAGQSPDSPGFACMETMALATETIGFDRNRSSSPAE